MYQIAIVEDNERDRTVIKECLKRFFDEKGLECKLAEFKSALLFLSNYAPVYDVVLFDVQMPYMDGMEGARRLREIDPLVPLAFITNMSSYAVKGYSVNAADFVVKPITYATIKAMMTKMIGIADNRARKIVVNSAQSIVSLDVNIIYYLDVFKHQVTYHTENGDYIVWTTLKEEAEKLPSDCFAKVNNYTYINLKFVEEIRGSEIILRGGVTVPISRSKKSAVVKAYLTYCGKYL